LAVGRQVRAQVDDLFPRHGALGREREHGHVTIVRPAGRDFRLLDLPGLRVEDWKGLDGARIHVGPIQREAQPRSAGHGLL